MTKNTEKIEYRCTRDAMYTGNCPGATDPAARQGHYVKAESPEEAARIMRHDFPSDDAGFTIEEWDGDGATRRRICLRGAAKPLTPAQAEVREEGIQVMHGLVFGLASALQRYGEEQTEIEYAELVELLVEDLDTAHKQAIEMQEALAVENETNEGSK